MTAAVPARPRRELGETLRGRIDHLAASAQREWRTPGLGLGVVRDGHIVHTAHVGAARLDPMTAPDDGTPFMIGSVTKTLTAVLVMQLRDAGRLALDDRLEQHLPGTPVGELTIRQLLSHLSGLQREPAGRVWEDLRAPDDAELLGRLDEAERVLAPHTVFHYSNLGYALLGQVVARLDGRSWEAAVTARLLEPLGMRHTGLVPGPDRAIGYYVEPHTGVATEEPFFDLAATAAMGGLWSTTADLLRYAAFLADPDPAVLAPDTLTEMSRPHVIVDPDAWTMGYGLSLSMARRGERIYLGHGGAMPGFLTGLRVSRRDRLGVVVWVNSSADAAPIALAADVLDAVLDAEPTRPEPWRPEQRHPEWDEIVGTWWVEGERMDFVVREGRLWSLQPGAGPVFESRYVADGPDRFRIDLGNERGELLELTRDVDGRLVRMHRASYAMTRAPLGFSELT